MESAVLELYLDYNVLTVKEFNKILGGLDNIYSIVDRSLNNCKRESLEILSFENGSIIAKLKGKAVVIALIGNLLTSAVYDIGKDQYHKVVAEKVPNITDSEFTSLIKEMRVLIRDVDYSKTIKNATIKIETAEKEIIIDLKK